MLHHPLAYIDPGAASILLQVVMSAVLGAGIFFRRSFARLYFWIRRGHADAESGGSQAPRTARPRAEAP